MREIQILLAEDNRADVLLVREALSAHNVPHQLHIAKDGEEAIDFIARMGKSPEAPCPDILLLDLNLPKIDGPEVLQEFRRHPECAATPVIIISSSDNSRDREKVSALGIAYYFKKPMDFGAFMELGRIIKDVVGAIP